MHSRSPTRSPPRVRRASSSGFMSSSSSIAAGFGAAAAVDNGSSAATGNTNTATGSSSNPKPNQNHVRVIVRIRPMNQEEAKSSRVCLYAEKVAVDPQQQSRNGGGASGVVGSLLGRLSLTGANTSSGTATTPPPSWACSSEHGEDDLDHGMILSNKEDLLVPNLHRHLSPHYSMVSPMRPITPPPSQQQQQAPQPQHLSKTVVVETNQQNVRRFSLDQVLPPTVTQQDTYASVGCDIKSIFRGYNVTILAYGQTASGKTFTMMGNASSSCDTKTPTPGMGDGVIPRAIHEIMMEQQQHQPQAVSVKLSCMEIYQDELRDLLVDQSKSNLTLRDAGASIQVRGLTAIKVDSLPQVLSFLSQAQERRRTGSTRLNERSSRSHMITTLTVVVTNKNNSHNNTPSNNKAQQQPLTAKLTLVDLAGSERIKETQVVGASLGESIQINTDLFTLGKVVNALCEKSPHVPYRDSKLTRLLKDALGGNCSTTLICCVSPSELYLEESINTLRYAERSRSITNSLQQNVLLRQNASPFEMAELRAENKRLKNQLLQLQKKLVQSSNSVGGAAAAVTSSSSSTLGREELESILLKMKQAEVLGRATRQSCELVSQQANKWHEQVELVKSSTSTEAERSEAKESAGKLSAATAAALIKGSTLDIDSRLSYELALIGDDEDSLVDDNDDELSTSPSLLSFDSTTKIKSLQVEVQALSKEKHTLKEILLEVSNQIEAKREDLEHLEEDYQQRRQDLAHEQERQEKLREELALEIAQMKLRLQESNGLLRGLGLLRGGFGNNGSSSSSNSNDGVGSSDPNVEVETRNLKKVETESMTLARDLAKSLAEERTRGEELLVQCQELQNRVQKLEKENQGLVARNHILEHDLKRGQQIGEGEGEQLNSNSAKMDDRKEEPVVEKAPVIREESSCATTASPTSNGDADALEQQDVGLVTRCESSEREGPHNELVKSEVQRILRCTGDAAMGTTCGSTVSSFGTELLPGTTTDENKSPQSGKKRNPFFISNIQAANQCTCEASMFASKAEHVEFYLPLLGVSCTCGKQPKVLSKENPCALESILRSWQVEFLKSVGIVDAIEFIHAFTHRDMALAAQMRKWRRQKRMLSVKTKSCRVALHIWYRTCKSVVRHVRQQQAKGVTHPERPDFLEIALGDNHTMSTLGGGSAYNPIKHPEEDAEIEV